MTFESKYSVGDEVLFVWNSEKYEGRILSVHINCVDGMKPMYSYTIYASMHGFTCVEQKHIIRKLGGK